MPSGARGLNRPHSVRAGCWRRRPARLGLRGRCFLVDVGFVFGGASGREELMDTPSPERYHYHATSIIVLYVVWQRRRLVVMEQKCTCVLLELYNCSRVFLLLGGGANLSPCCFVFWFVFSSVFKRSAPVDAAGQGEWDNGVRVVIGLLLY